MHPAKTQIRLGIRRPVWSESWLCTWWIEKDPNFLHANSEDSDQTQGRCSGWSESWLGTQVILLVLSCCGSNFSFYQTDTKTETEFKGDNLNYYTPTRIWSWPNLNLDNIFVAKLHNKEWNANPIYWYHNDPKFLDRLVWANSVDPIRLLLEEQSDQGLHCLPFQLHLLGALLFGKPSCSNFRVIIANVLGVRIFRSFTVFFFYYHRCQQQSHLEAKMKKIRFSLRILNECIDFSSRPHLLTLAYVLNGYLCNTTIFCSLWLFYLYEKL